ncbi:MAG: transglycosylase domain-containing protein [Oligoflexales bacterium]
MLIRLFMCVLMVLLGVGTYSVCLLLDTLPDIHSGHQHRLTKLYDRHFHFLGFVNSKSSAAVEFEKIPKHTIRALLAAEDRHFFSHHGFHLPSIARATLANITTGRRQQGASTITQQLARLVYLNSRKTYQRKIQEIILAISLERRLSKKQILEAYLNHAYFGAGAYGIESASQRYFSKTASKLKSYESALLIGLLKAPSALAPHRHPQKAITRRNEVLKAMGQRYAKKWRKPLRLRMNDPVELLGYLQSQLKTEVMQIDSKSSSRDKDDKVMSTLDVRLQKNLAHLHLSLPHTMKKIQLAAVVLSPDGEVLALQGGKQYKSSSYNRSLFLKRNPGEIMWPLTVTTAFSQGWELQTPVAGLQSRWSPSLKDTLEKSDRTGVALLVTRLNRAKLHRAHRTLGLSSGKDTQMAMGQKGISPLAIASAYGAILHHGVRCQPRILEKTECFPYTPWAAKHVKKTQQVFSRLYPKQSMMAVAQDKKDAWIVSWKYQQMTVLWLGSEYGRERIAKKKIEVKETLLKLLEKIHSPHVNNSTRPIFASHL